VDVALLIFWKPGTAQVNSEFDQKNDCADILVCENSAYHLTVANAETVVTETKTQTDNCPPVEITRDCLNTAETIVAAPPPLP
jgi:hypothetical protein